MDEASSRPATGPRRPLRQRSNSAVPTLGLMISAKDKERKEHRGRTTSPFHRPSRSVQHISPHSLLPHYNSHRRQSSSHARYNKTDMDNILPELSRKIGMMKDHSHSSSSNPTRKDVEPVVEEADRVRQAALIAKEKQRAEEQEKEIQSVYQTVSNMSMESTRKLDDIYYSILERLSTLHSTINSLHELSTHTKELRATFQSDANDLRTDMNGHIDAFNGFQKQQYRIDGLESRMKDSKSKTDALTKRLEAARERVQVLENQEAEVQASISFQFRIVWFILGAFVTGVVALLVAHYFIPMSHHELQDALGAISNEFPIPVAIPRTPSPAAEQPQEPSSPIQRSTFRQSNVPTTSNHPSSTQRESVCSVEREPSINTKSLDEDPRLRLFEEL